MSFAPTRRLFLAPGRHEFWASSPLHATTGEGMLVAGPHLHWYVPHSVYVAGRSPLC